MPKVTKTNKKVDWNTLSAPTVKKIYFDTNETVELRSQLAELTEEEARVQTIERIAESRAFMEIRAIPYEIQLEVKNQCTNYIEQRNTGREYVEDDKGNKVAPNGMGLYEKVNSELNAAAFVAAGIVDNDIIPGTTWAEKGQALLKSRSAQWILSISQEIRKISQVDSGRIDGFFGL